MEELLKEYGRKLRLWRRDKGISQKKLASKLGISHAARVSSFENGHKSTERDEFLLKKFVETNILLLDTGRTPEPIDLPAPERIQVIHQYKRRAPKRYVAPDNRLQVLMKWLFINQGTFATEQEWRQALINKLEEIL